MFKYVKWPPKKKKPFYNIPLYNLKHNFADSKLWIGEYLKDKKTSGQVGWLGGWVESKLGQKYSVNGQGPVLAAPFQSLAHFTIGKHWHVPLAWSHPKTPWDPSIRDALTAY